MASLRSATVSPPQLEEVPFIGTIKLVRTDSVQYYRERLLAISSISFLILVQRQCRFFQVKIFDLEETHGNNM